MEALAAIPGLIGSGVSAVGSGVSAAAPFLGAASFIPAIFGGGGRGLDRVIKQMRQSSAWATPRGRELISGAQAGKLTPAQQANVDKYKTEELAKWRQYLANAGIPESSAMRDVEGRINQEALALSQKFLNENFNEGMQLLGLAGTELGNVITSLSSEDKASREALTGAGAAFLRLGGRQQPPQPPQPPTGP